MQVDLYEAEEEEEEATEVRDSRTAEQVSTLYKIHSSFYIFASIKEDAEQSGRAAKLQQLLADVSALAKSNVDEYIHCITSDADWYTLDQETLISLVASSISWQVRRDQHPSPQKPP